MAGIGSFPLIFLFVLVFLTSGCGSEFQSQPEADEDRASQRNNSVYNEAVDHPSDLAAGKYSYFGRSYYYNAQSAYCQTSFSTNHPKLNKEEALYIAKMRFDGRCANGSPGTSLFGDESKTPSSPDHSTSVSPGHWTFNGRGYYFNARDAYCQTGYNKSHPKLTNSEAQEIAKFRFGGRCADGSPGTPILGANQPSNPSPSVRTDYHHYNPLAWEGIGVAIVFCPNSPRYTSCRINGRSMARHGSQDKGRDVWTIRGITRLSGTIECRNGTQVFSRQVYGFGGMQWGKCP